MKQLNKLIFFTVLTTVSFSVFSQSDEGLALSLKKLHPDDFHALAYKSEVYEFDIAKNTEKQPVCIVKSNVNERYLSLRNGYSYQVAEFYDKFSTIEKFKVEINSINRMGKPAMRSFTNAIDKSISSEDIFYDDTRVKFFNVSNQDLGEECKSHIEKTYTDSKYLTSIYLQENCPVEEKNVQLIVPLDVEIEIREMNFKGYKIEKTKETKGKKTIYNYVIKRAAAIKNEPHSPGIGYTAPHLVVWVKSFIYDKQNITGFATANDLHKWYKFLYAKTNNQPQILQPLVKQLVQGINTDEDKIKAIYYWVQDKIRYIAFEDGYAGFIPDAAQNVYKNKYGDCKGMANLLTEMLKLAGYDAHLTWIGTKHLPYDQTFTALCVANHCICTVYLKGTPLFLDATEKYNSMGEYAYRIQGKEAVVDKNDSFDIIKIPVAQGNQNKISTSAALKLNETNITGHVKVTLTGEERTQFLQYYEELPNAGKKEILNDFLKFGNNNINATNVKTSDLKNRDIPVVIEGDINYANEITIIDNEIFAGIDFFPKTFKTYLPAEKRVSDFEFNSIYTQEDNIELTVNNNQLFKSLPEKLYLENKDFSFNGAYVVKGNTIILNKSFSIKTGMVKKDQFNEWKEFLLKIKDFNTNVVTIEKK